jgi:hypothetical protein
MQLFLTWLGFPLSFQVEDLTMLLREPVTEEWNLLYLAQGGFLERLIPAGAMPAERDLFTNDLQIALRAAMRGPEAGGDSKRVPIQ